MLPLFRRHFDYFDYAIIDIDTITLSFPFLLSFVYLFRCHFFLLFFFSKLPLHEAASFAAYLSLFFQAFSSSAIDAFHFIFDVIFIDIDDISHFDY
jgi:hypothetical protein